MTGTFTAHNIRLDDGNETYPAAGRIVADFPIARSMIRLLKHVFPQGLKEKRLVDLGCLEGGFTTEFARLGLDATGIEVRQSNYENCMFLKHNTKLSNLHFVHDNAWNCNKYGPFDITFCVGLYYHIEEPKRFLEEMAKGCRKLIFLDTHYAPDRDDVAAVQKFALSPLMLHEGMPGRWYAEHGLDPEKNKAQLDQMKWASWENHKSFWLTKPALFSLLLDNGFDTVFELFDREANLPKDLGPRGYVDNESRTMFVGIRS